MVLQQALESVATFGVPDRFDDLRRHIDAQWIAEVLATTGTATLRRRRLPAEQVIWVVIGMALFRNLSIERLVDELDLALPTERRELVAKSGVTQARQRLGEEPLALLFAMLACEWAARSAEAHRWRGLALYAADGTTMRVADSDENRAAFGGQRAGRGRGESGYPIVRLVALMALRSRILSAVRIADYHSGEPTIAKELWRELPDNSLTIVDRGFLIADELTHLEQSGQSRHWLTRAKANTQIRRIKRLGRNDYLVEIRLSPATRSVHPELPDMWIARAITYQRRGCRPSVLLTSLLDAEAYPTMEIVALYHERWDIELAYDEVKTHLLEREETIRSRTPDGVRQEIWGIAIAYNLVRREMEQAANEAGVEPSRISFVAALALVRSELLTCSARPIAAGNIPRYLAALRLNLKRLVLPQRRPERSYPRAVKLKMSNYQRKRPPTRRPPK